MGTKNRRRKGTSWRNRSLSRISVSQARVYLDMCICGRLSSSKWMHGMTMLPRGLGI